MKFRPTKKVIIIGLLYVIVFCGLALLWDILWKSKLPITANAIVGLFTIIGGFLLAYWIIERRRLEREEELEQEKIKNEIERKSRIIRDLNLFKNSLLPWLFHLACVLSNDRFLNYDNNKIRSGRYKDDIPELQDIFAVSSFEGGTGKRLSGTDNADAVCMGVLKKPQTPQTLYGTLLYGLSSLVPIENQIAKFGSIIEEIDPEAADIILLRNLIGSRISDLEYWEKAHDKDVSAKIDTAGISNIQKVGARALNIISAIEKTIEEFDLRIKELTTEQNNGNKKGGQQMPKELKALVHISVWVLFLFACVMLINTIVQSWFGGLSAELTMAGGTISMGSFFLSAVAALIRHKME